MARISRLNRLPEPEKKNVYRLLIPEKVYQLFAIDASTGRNRQGESVVRFECAPGTAEASVEVKRLLDDLDPVFYIEVADSKDLLQLQWYFIQVNDLRVPRINTDVTRGGRSRWLFWQERNLPEELKALAAGLAPGQVRPGLRLTDDINHCLDRFCRALGLASIYLEALFYHLALAYERNGFRYLQGEELMRLINRGFQPGGRIYAKLDDSPFRRKDFYNRVRGRSWAIHDGILDEPADPEIGSWNPPRMYRMVGDYENYVNTCPEGCW